MNNRTIKNYITTGQWAISLLVFVILLGVCNRGLDLTDESYYISWTIQPGQFKALIHPFGLVLHPLFVALGRSIIAMRISGVLAATGSGLILGLYIEKYYKIVECHELNFDARALGALFATGNYIAVTILTPGYNMLANVASCLVVAGALGWATSDARAGRNWREDAMPSVLVGVGGALAALAKPTFAILALLAVLVQLFSCWQQNPARAWRRAAFVAVSCMVPLIAAVTGTVPFAQLVKAIQAGQSTLNFGNSLAELPYKTMHDLMHMPTTLILTIMACLALWAFRSKQHGAPRWMVFASFSVLCIAVAYLGGSMVRALARNSGPGEALGAPTLAVMFSLVTLIRVKSADSGLSWRAWWPVTVLIVLPLAIAFGTANNLAAQTGISLYATLLALAIATDLFYLRRAAIAWQMALSAFTVILLGWASFVPHGLTGSIWSQTTPMRFEPTGETLYVDSQTANYALALERIALANGLTPNTPVVDLTGGGPGTVLLLGGRAPYFPWIVHIFGDASRRLVDTVWHSLGSAEQSRAWIVLPLDSAFADSNVAADIRHESDRHLAGRVPMIFWNTTKRVEIWVPSQSAR